MSFWTTFYFVRPGPPTKVTTGQLAEFVGRFRAEVAPTESPSSFRVMYGWRIGRDTRLIDEERVTKIGKAFISTAITRPLDIDTDSYDDALTALARRPKRVYRADLQLGGVKAIPCVPVEANDHGLTLYGCGLEIGPISISGLELSEPTQIGWMGFSIGGPGYSWPRPTHEIRADLERSAQVQAAMAICREAWPFEPTPPKHDLIEGRQSLGPLWPYKNIDRPNDWSWFVSESG